MDDPAPRTPSPRLDGARFIAGTLVAGYGLLILLGFLAHESLIVGAILVIAGAALLFVGRSRRPTGQPPGTPGRRAGHDVQPSGRGWSIFTGTLGLAMVAGLIGYNVLAESGLELPEIAILAYGVAMAVASRHLDRPVRGDMTVGTMVAWSIPLVAAPLGVYALDAILDAQVGGSPLDGIIRVALVQPVAWTLGALGFDVTAFNQTVMMTTPRGKLALSIGLVCAGLHPGILFLGIFTLHAWQERTPPRRLAWLLVLGLVGVYIANLVRLVILALVGYEWGGATLQSAHANAGWMIFVVWMMGYWWFVLQPGTAPAAPGGGRGGAGEVG